MQADSFSMIEDDIIMMITGQKGYLITKSDSDKIIFFSVSAYY
jgi:hypothetical protein